MQLWNFWMCLDAIIGIPRRTGSINDVFRSEVWIRKIVCGSGWYLFPRILVPKKVPGKNSPIFLAYKNGPFLRVLKAYQCRDPKFS